MAPNNEDAASFYVINNTFQAPFLGKFVAIFNCIMDAQLLNSLTDLQPTTLTNWRIRVRVSRKWCNTFGGSTKTGVNLIFVDASVSMFSFTLNHKSN